MSSTSLNAVSVLSSLAPIGGEGRGQGAKRTAYQASPETDLTRQPLSRTVLQETIIAP